MSNEPTTEVELAVSSVATKAWNRVQNFVPDLKKQFVDNAISLLKEQGHSLAESEEGASMNQNIMISDIH